jgi:hypothetical protein
MDNLFTCNEREAKLMLDLLESQIQTLHNHIASSVEAAARGGDTRADPASLVRQLRQHQSLAARIRGYLYPVASR